MTEHLINGEALASFGGVCLLAVSLYLVGYSYDRRCVSGVLCSLILGIVAVLAPLMFILSRT